jgi:signal peptide peptidase SppA
MDEQKKIPLWADHLGPAVWAIAREAFPNLVRSAQIEIPAAMAAELEKRAPRTRVAARLPKGGRPLASAGDLDPGSGQVAIIPLTGLIRPRSSFLSWLFGGAYGGLVGFQQDLQEAVADPNITAIVIDVDSPGGLTDLVPETAALIRSLRGTKPIIAVANTLAASAAYWLAAQADELVITPSGKAGSIGVFVVHEDWSSFNTKFGVEPTYISAGKYKTDGNPDEPLTPSATEELQQLVEDLYSMFVADVATGRGVSTDTVEAGYGQGRALLASRALEAGLVDRIATIDDVINGLLPGFSASASSPWAFLPGAPAPKALDAGEADDEPAPAAQDQCPDCGQYMPNDGDHDCPQKPEDEPDEDPDDAEDDIEQDEEDDDETAEPGPTKAVADPRAVGDVLFAT